MTGASRAGLERMLAAARALAAGRLADAALAARLDRLAAWQSLRLGRSYADLEQQARYRPAIRFFQQDLYGAGDFSRRDEDLARIVPLLARLLPEPVLATVGKAAALSVLTQELDRKLEQHLPDAPRITVEAYCEAYRRCANPEARSEQIDLIVEVGTALDRHVAKPMLRGTLALMRKPAQLAGFAALQSFLERGVDAFYAMRGAAAFLATVERRERALMHALFAGDASPFDDPASPPRSV